MNIFTKLCDLYILTTYVNVIEILTLYEDRAGLIFFPYFFEWLGMVIFLFIFDVCDFAVRKNGDLFLAIIPYIFVNSGCSHGRRRTDKTRTDTDSQNTDGLGQTSKFNIFLCFSL
uniref:Uncharacterized protein n=1 Tax=Meloidogyne enterolobii TaxID=390850 RepID=A0A6V7WJN1_MELEN|nr:unnamed protein product [Meloidogyne enterolobii]